MGYNKEIVVLYKFVQRVKRDDVALVEEHQDLMRQYNPNFAVLGWMAALLELSDLIRNGSGADLRLGSFALTTLTSNLG